MIKILINETCTKDASRYNKKITIFGLQIWYKGYQQFNNDKPVVEVKGFKKDK